MTLSQLLKRTTPIGGWGTSKRKIAKDISRPIMWNLITRRRVCFFVLFTVVGPGFARVKIVFEMEKVKAKERKFKISSRSVHVTHKLNKFASAGGDPTSSFSLATRR